MYVYLETASDVRLLTGRLVCRSLGEMPALVLHWQRLQVQSCVPSTGSGRGEAIRCPLKFLA